MAELEGPEIRVWLYGPGKWVWRCGSCFVDHVERVERTEEHARAEAAEHYATCPMWHPHGGKGWTA